VNINPLEFMKNMQDMQSKMGDMQEKLKNISATGSAGGGLVEICMNGQMEVSSVKLDPLCVDSRDIKMLEDLIQSAFVAASSNIKEKIKSEVAGDLNLPPGMAGF
jgi:DNA-binding YbaB/EbfC family protein